MQFPLLPRHGRSSPLKRKGRHVRESQAELREWPKEQAVPEEKRHLIQKVSRIKYLGCSAAATWEHQKHRGSSDTRAGCELGVGLRRKCTRQQTVQRKASVELVALASSQFVWRLNWSKQCSFKKH